MSSDVQLLVTRSLAQDACLVESAARELFSKIVMAGVKDVAREPPADVVDEGDKFVIIMDLPGFKKDNIKVRVGLDYVEVSATSEHQVNGKLLRAERLSNFKVYRRIALPSKIRVSDVKAHLRDGMLTIILPKLPDQAELLNVTIE